MIANMARLSLIFGGFSLFFAGSAAVYWARPDPAPAIAAELRAIANDPANASPLAALLRQERSAQTHLATATFATPCFWSGEARFGSIDGVEQTTPGYLDGHEVVRVAYDPAKVTYEALQDRADPKQALGDDAASRDAVCAFNAAASRESKTDRRFHPDDQPKWYLRQSELKHIPMSPAQAARVNALAHAHASLDAWLTPRQRAVRDRWRGVNDDAPAAAINHPLAWWR